MPVSVDGMTLSHRKYDAKYFIFSQDFSVCYKSHLTWYKLEQGCDAKHLFSHNFLMQQEWGLHDDLDQSLVMGMKPTFPGAHGCTRLEFCQ